jgi:hypothetical protein
MPLPQIDDSYIHFDIKGNLLHKDTTDALLYEEERQSN